MKIKFCDYIKKAKVGNIFYAVKFDEELKSDGKIDFTDEKIRAMFSKLEIIQKPL